MFLAAKERSLGVLEESWIRFVKHDFNNYVESVVVLASVEILAVAELLFRIILCTCTVPNMAWSDATALALRLCDPERRPTT